MAKKVVRKTKGAGSAAKPKVKTSTYKPSKEYVKIKKIIKRMRKRFR